MDVVIILTALIQYGSTKMIQIKYIKEVRGHSIGEIVNISQRGGDSAVAAGVAEYFDQEKELKDAAKFYSDKRLIENNPKTPEWQATASPDKIFASDSGLGMGLGVDKKNFNKIKGITEPTQEFKKAAKIFSGKMELAERFIDMQPIFYDFNGLWWIWNNGDKCWEMTDEVTITNHLYLSLGYDTINSKERSEIIQALKQVGRLHRPTELPRTWIQFKDKLVDSITGEEIDASPEYFTLNPIPYALGSERYILTPIMDKIFEEWVGKEHVQTLYEIIAYCLIPDYPIHRLFCFIGSGLNGKSCYLRLIEKFIGRKNICSTELDTLLSSRFEVTRLHKKLVCVMGETNFNEISKTSILKKLTGQDLIGFEYKNKNPFEERSYAKILISTNNLPETTDKTIGFYRRWLIIDFPNQFNEDGDILATIPEEEYVALSNKCIFILKDLLNKRKFHAEGDIETRQKTYEDKSNPFDKFFKENVGEDPSADIPKWEFEKRLNEWCKHNRFREMSSHVIAKKMKEHQISEIRLWKEWYENNFLVKKQVRCWVGIKWEM